MTGPTSNKDPTMPTHRTPKDMTGEDMLLIILATTTNLAAELLKRGDRAGAHALTALVRTLELFLVTQGKPT